ncbi:RNA-binding protein [Thioalkalivibrio paradoxus]|uniref:Uncharacterized protein n=1 Tax=Thioalkalivibrio paradoxus ARh 1 TaxID=713585 RepID=W0DSR7_9GAMM|nr:hypothetical protein [Thioalkalivibrio paradoxus]AHE99905.1 hypothetical protein THITH_03345 [Thioalkalivibrio paradoxus ARh 1]
MMDVTEAGLLALTPGGRVVCGDPQSPLCAVFVESEAAGLAQLAGRKAAGAADATFAAELGVSAQTIANWENRVGTLRLQTRSQNRLRRLYERSG